MDMPKGWKATLGALLLIIGLQPMTAVAGRNCEERPADAQKTQKAIRLATQVRDTLELSGASLVVISRIGSDQSKRGVRYTHVGYLLKEHPSGPWTVVHELNNCGSGNSELFDEGLANFFMDDPFDFETQIVIPSAVVQERLARTLLSPTKRAMHEVSYSSIANPWSTKHQNSNGWALEIYAAAQGDLRSRTEAQRWLKENGYQPSVIRIGGGERAGARLFTPNIRFGDHPDTAWQTQSYEVSTGDSALDFFRKADPDARVITQRLDGRAVLEKKPASSPKPTEIVRAPTSPASVPAPTASPTSAPAPQNRAQLLQSMQGLIVPYACRPQGYLSQCRQMERSLCERAVSEAVLRCFATVSDQQLLNGSEQAAMQQMQEIGYCAVESVEASFMTTTGKPGRTAQGSVCPNVRNYK